MGTYLTASVKSTTLKSSPLHITPASDRNGLGSKLNCLVGTTSGFVFGARPEHFLMLQLLPGLGRSVGQPDAATPKSRLVPEELRVYCIWGSFPVALLRL